MFEMVLLGDNTWVTFHKESLCPRDEFRLFPFTVITDIEWSVSFI